jgi:hypothetical protein
MTKPPPPSLDQLDETSRREAEAAQAAMRELLALLPRRFAYEDEIALVFRPDHAR